MSTFHPQSVAQSPCTHTVFFPRGQLDRPHFTCNSKLAEVETGYRTSSSPRPSMEEYRRQARQAPWESVQINTDNAIPLSKTIPPWKQVWKPDQKSNSQRAAEQENADDQEQVMSPMACIVAKLLTIQQPCDQPHKAMSQLKSGPVACKNNLLDSKLPWKSEGVSKQQKEDEGSNQKKPLSLAELIIPFYELQRLREIAINMKQKIKVGRHGITDKIVNNIKDQWHKSELVRLKCEKPASVNMKKIHQDLECKSGGLVVWRTGSVVVVYRGVDYDTEHGLASSLTKKLEGLVSHETKAKLLTQGSAEERNDGEIHLDTSSPALDEVDTVVTKEEAGKEEEETDGYWLTRDIESHVVQAIQNMSVEPDPFANLDSEKEIESLLDNLGPRYHAWSGTRPIPVDADLLPAIVPNFRPPYRILPHGVRQGLTDSQLTNLRRLTRHLAPHFVLGRNKGNQGLAVGMVKLWEKSEIAKIAIKRGVQNTNNKTMAEELKHLTGGILLSRDKLFITFYRGKDFIPHQVAAALAERELMVQALQEEEERVRDDRSIMVERVSAVQPSVAVVFKGPPHVQPSWMHTLDLEEQSKLKNKAIKARCLALISQLEKKFSVASKKKERAEQEISKINAYLKPVDELDDTEVITEEERFMFRKLGLKMTEYLILGRRGVFDGVVENMHLYWKHRELVKIILKENDQAEVQFTARFLERESGGVLVAVVDISKGCHAMIFYRGKNYRRPLELRPRSLLNKYKALKRSHAMQRHTSLGEHIQALQMEMDELKSKLNALCGQKFKQWKNSEWILQNDTVKMKGLIKLVQRCPLYRANPVTLAEKFQLQERGALLERVYYFHVGNSNGLEDFARALRVYFLKHALVKIGLKGGYHTPSRQAFVAKLEDFTGGAIVSDETSVVLLYRGWPEGEELPGLEQLFANPHADLVVVKGENHNNFWDGDEYLINGVVEDNDEKDEDTDQEGFKASVHLEEDEDDNEADSTRRLSSVAFIWP